MDIIITYDINTETREGRRRLRKVAEICLNYGQRVQFSVFECSVSEMQLDQLLHQLEEEINIKSDSVRMYRLPGGRSALVSALGRDSYIDFCGPLVV
ncbi:CRISPR-associated endoribonuclease Cas2 1 [Azospirillaceae bacterium]